MTTTLDRQMLGCPYEAPLPPALAGKLSLWDHPAREVGPDEVSELGVVATPVCIGYLVRLPELHEVSRARMHWGKGELHSWTGAEHPSEHLLHGIEVLEVATSQVERWAMTPKDKGGGAG
jgi:hypothetical protein